MDLAEQARKDPRVGDKWESSQGIVEIKDVNENFVFAEWSNDKGEPARHLRTLWPNIVAPWWTLAARGPAPATPERDPKKDPRAGDKFEARGRQWSDEVVHRDENSVFTRRCISGFFHSEKDISIDDWPEYVKHDIVVFIAPEVRARDPYTTPVVGDEWECVGSNDFYIVKQPRAKAVGYVLKTCLGNEYPHEVDYESFAALSKQWRLHRRGDDPAWRPEGEQPAAGIKVGDRVRVLVGDNKDSIGVVDEIVDGRVWIGLDNGRRRYVCLPEWSKWLTIIPPAAPEPEQDDTGDEPPTPERPGDPRFYAALEYLAKLHESKAADYGSKKDVFANIRATEDIGIPAWKGAWMRAKDKVKRVDSYCVNGRLKNEGVKDSFMDLAAYSIIASIMHDEQEQTK